ncbi:ABC transporter permease [Tessaracoccus sp. OS52]|uniref:ABC transporter permease subunit n=1 Tax=Tessaracoccus sp. OS52 TaxID=2886691 RepID=UPI001D11116B|nr:ABC transporter permease subunit [Tessaracoccus sp. OS52]MCC2592063.1 ABC transporter permease [Tessaracoccus sp. OS52]
MPIFIQVMRESWRGVIYWGLALLAVMSLYLSFYSSMGNAEGLQLMMNQLPEGMTAAFGFRDIGSGAGWAHSTFFGLLGLFILSAACISWGARAIAGDEEEGMLELTLAHRVSRTQLYLERLLGMVFRLLLLGVIVAGGLVLLDGPAGLELDFGNIPPQVVAYLGVGLVCGTCALAVGAVTGDRGRATGAGAAVLVGGFLLNALANVDEGNEWMATISPVSWAYENRPLINGWDFEGIALLYGLTAVLVLVGWLGFTRRDVTA